MKVKLGSMSKEREPQRYSHTDPFAGFPFDEPRAPWNSIYLAAAGAATLFALLFPWIR